ncbi:MAG TPA: glycine-rich domain-containing protein-like [Telluria sp.]|jgi:hypothetical protein
MFNNATFQAIAALDLEPIKMKLMHVASGEGWSQARADAMEIEYRRFLYLMHAFPNEETAPTVDVDTFWHYHILDTAKYAADCEQVFGYFLHHYPYLGMDGGTEEGAEERGAARMRTLYETTFGEDYIRAEAYGGAAYCMIRPDAQAAADGAPDAHARDATAAGAQAAYCMIRPGSKAANGADAAYCMIRPGSKAAHGAAAAYCMIRPGSKAAHGADAAYCMLRPDGKAAQGAQAAYCMVRPGSKTASGAQDMRHRGAAAANGAQGAYCMIRPGAEAARGAKVAYCMLRPGTAANKGAQAAYCMLRPDAQAAAQGKAAGAVSSDCMVRPHAQEGAAGAMAMAA